MLTRLVCSTAAVLAAGATVALAAGLDVSSQRLSTASGSAAVPTTTCSAPASADAWIDQAQPTTSLGTGTQVHVRSYDTTLLILLGARQNARTLARFDLSACAIPVSAAIRRARLRLHLDQAPGASRTYAVKRVTSAWSESTVTWNTAPSVATLATAQTATGTTSGTMLEWDVTADAEGFVSGALTNHGWRIDDLLEDSTTQYEGRFASRESTTAANRPQLVITYWP